MAWPSLLFYREYRPIPRLGLMLERAFNDAFDADDDISFWRHLIFLAPI